MAAETGIEWCDSTFNPWTGCTKVSPGCDHCYAEGWAKRSGTVQWGPHAERRRTTDANWRKPLHWEREHEAFQALHGRRRRVFCASLADVFDNQVPVAWRIDLLRLIEQTPRLDWLLLTKRIGNVERLLDEAAELMPEVLRWPLPNVWLGATVVNQEEADRDVPKLLSVPSRVRFLSIEPMLGPIDLTGIPVSGSGHSEFDPIVTANVLQRVMAYPPLPQIDWVICGGESGPGARPMHPAWARSLRDQCSSAGVPFLFKQWGEWIGVPDLRRLPGGKCPGFGAFDRCRYDREHEAVRIGKKAAGRLLDGREHTEFPKDFR